MQSKDDDDDGDGDELEMMAGKVVDEAVAILFLPEKKLPSLLRMLTVSEDRDGKGDHKTEAKREAAACSPFKPSTLWRHCMLRLNRQTHSATMQCNGYCRQNEIACSLSFSLSLFHHRIAFHNFFRSFHLLLLVFFLSSPLLSTLHLMPFDMAAARVNLLLLLLLQLQLLLMLRATETGNEQQQKQQKLKLRQKQTGDKINFYCTIYVSFSRSSGGGGSGRRERPSKQAKDSDRPAKSACWCYSQ